MELWLTNSDRCLFFLLSFFDSDAYLLSVLPSVGTVALIVQIDIGFS